MNERKGQPVPSFAAAVRAAIKSKDNPNGMTQRALAAAAGTSPSAINGLLKGTSAPSLDLASRIALALQLPHKVSDFAKPAESVE
jgi:DNA-binding XRE family transcriptional regulator